MTNSKHSDRHGVPLAVILGTNEIASAIAVRLRRDGYGVVMSHDPLPPVIRRKMAFHDALYDDGVTVDGVVAERRDTGLQIRAALSRAPGVIVTELGLLDLIVLQMLDVLVDARLQKYRATPDLRRLARFTIGLGPGFSGGSNCDVAIETQPGKTGRLLPHGATEKPDRTPSHLGELGEERFVRAAVSGRWHTAVEIGTRIFKNFVVGYLGNIPVRAPLDGFLRGIVRDSTEVPAGAKLIEIDPRARRAAWAGLDGRGQLIARAIARAISLRGTTVSETNASNLHLVK